MCEQTRVGENIAHFRGQMADYQGGHNVEFLRGHGEVMVQPPGCKTKGQAPTMEGLGLGRIQRL